MPCVKINRESSETIPKPLSAVVFATWQEKLKKTNFKWIVNPFWAKNQKSPQTYFKTLLKDPKDM